MNAKIVVRAFAIVFLLVLGCRESIAQQLVYCASRGPGDPIQCFSTLEAAEGRLKSPMTPGVPDGRHLLQPKEPKEIDASGRVIRYYAVPPIDGTFVASHYKAGVCNDKPDRACKSEDQLEAAIIEACGIDPGCRGNFVGNYWETVQTTFWYTIFPDEIYSYHGALDSRSRRFHGGDAPNRRYYHRSPPRYPHVQFERDDVYSCPDFYRGYSAGYQWAGGYGPLKWPNFCVNIQLGNITVNEIKQSNSCPKSGNPCVPATGAKEYHDTDFDWSGLSFTRSYTSLGELPLASTMGNNWAHALSHRLHPSTSTNGPVAWVDERGHYERFVYVRASTSYFSENVLGATLKRATGGVEAWTLVRSSGDELGFDAAGKLIRHGIADRRIELSYCTAADVDQQLCVEADLLKSATNAQGRSLAFAYERINHQISGGPSATRSVRLVSISDEFGLRVRYLWDGFARLAGVEFPASASGVPALREFRYAESNHMCRLANGSLEPGCDPAARAAAFSNHLTGIVDENGVRMADYTYDSLGRVTQSQHAGNANRVSLSYLSASQVRVTQPEGGSRLYTFSTGRFRKLLSSVEETTDGSVTGTTTHDVNTTTFRRNHTVDARGTRTNYTHDAFRETGRTEGLTAAGATTPLTRSTTSTWDNTLNRMLSRTEPGREIRLSYNPRGQVTARCEIDSAVPSAMAYAVCGSAANAPVGVRQSLYTYCEAADVAAANSTCPVLGALKSVDGPRTDVADVTSYAYYASTDESGCASTGPCYRKGDRHTVTNALGHVTAHASYDRAGRLTRSVDANGVATELVYHPRGWLVSRTVKGATVAEDARTTFAYAATGLVQRITQADGSYLVYGYDDAHRLISVTDALGNRIDYTLDPAGNRTSETTFDPQNAVKRQLSRVYNQLGQLREQRDAQLRAYVSEYDANGNSTASTDPLNVRSTQSFDPLNRLQQSLQDVGGLNVSTGYRYDAQDRLTKVIDPKNLETNYTYNGLGDLTQLSSPDTGITSYTVDAAGNRLTQTDARGVTVTMQYDALNRLLRQSNSQDGELIVYQYDGAAGCSAGNFGLGRLSQIEDNMGTLSYCYDRRGNVVHKTRTRMTQGQPTPTLHWELGYRYSLADQLQAVIYPDGGEAQYSHDAAGRISSLSFRASAAAPLQPVITQVDYAPFGPSVRLVYANGSQWTRALDADYRIDSITAPGIGYDYSLDAVGNITGIAQGAASHSFEYDDLYRLTAMKQGPSVLEGFGYDPTGNRLSASAGQATQSYLYPVDSHRLQSVAGTARGYTPAGNTATLGNRNLQYSGFNRLSDISVGNVQPIQLQANTYSGRGEREQRRTGSVDRYFGYDEGGQLLFEAEQAAGSAVQFTTRYLWLGNQPVALVTGATAAAYPGELLHIHADHLGTPRAISRPNASNAVVWRWALEGSAFGQHPAQSDSDADGLELEFNLRYPGQYLDSATGWHYNYFRDYEPATGRYVQSDSIGLAGGISTYGYALQTPLLAYDSRGMQATLAWCLGGPGGCAIGVAVGAVCAYGASQAISSADESGSSQSNVIPFPVPKPRNCNGGGSNSGGSCNDNQCPLAAGAGYIVRGEYGSVVTCAYLCPRKGFQYYTINLAFRSENPWFLCPLFRPESSF